jgi:hypothetical protein
MRHSFPTKQLVADITRTIVVTNLTKRNAPSPEAGLPRTIQTDGADLLGLRGSVICLCIVRRGHISLHYIHYPVLVLDGHLTLHTRESIRAVRWSKTSSCFPNTSIRARIEHNGRSETLMGGQVRKCGGAAS